MAGEFREGFIRGWRVEREKRERFRSSWAWDYCGYAVIATSLCAGLLDVPALGAMIAVLFVIFSVRF